MGLPVHFIDQGEVCQLWQDCGLDAPGLERQIRARLQSLTHPNRALG
ncbi:hypothetical protein CARN8_390001 [mine drainage metagenome]|uniref:Uncharacterized protein n=1 Tax=mine drainage metagenome TaxID=410659 RepID=A0A3P3ZPD0_9ZZZZ